MLPAHCYSRRRWLGLLAGALVPLGRPFANEPREPFTPRLAGDALDWVPGAAPRTAGPQTADMGIPSGIGDAPHEGLWRCTGMGTAEQDLDESVGLCAMRGGRFILFVASTTPAGLVWAATGTTRAEGTTLHLSVEAGLSSRAAARSIEPWQPSLWTVSRRDDTLTLTAGDRQLRCVRQGLGLGQSARLDRGALTLADDRFVLVSMGPAGTHAGTGTFYRRGTVFTLMPDQWAAHTADGFTSEPPGTLTVEAKRPSIAVPGGIEIPILESLSFRPPRAPRRRR